MKFVNVRDLKDHASAILRGVRRGNEVVVTNWGKPQAALVPLDEKGLENFILRRHRRRKNGKGT